MIVLGGFAPDLDSTVPGVLSDCSHLIPSERGFIAAATLESTPSPALSSPSTGGAVISKVDDARRIFAGTDTEIYELIASAWTVRSRVGAYSGAKWRFTQFGDVTIAATGVSPMQASTSSDFSDLAGSPVAQYNCVSNGFVLAFNGPVMLPDGWACSGLYNHATWTPDPATQAANGRFLDTPGPVVGAKALGNVVVVYKARSMFVGQYVGPPIVWSWSRVAGGEIGAISNECIVDVGDAHYFIGVDDFWVFDGTRPVSLNAPVRRWFFANSDANYRHKTIGMFDRYNNRIYWYFCGLDSGGVVNKCLVLNVKTGKWGRDDNVIQAGMQYVSPGLTWGQLWAGLSSSWAAWPASPYSSIFPANGSPVPAVFTSSNQLSVLAGPAAASSLVTGDIGADDAESLLSKVSLRFLKTPSSVSAQGFCKAVEGDILETGSQGYYHDGRIDIMQAARWHRLSINFTGDAEIVGFTPTVQGDGAR